MKVTSAFTLLGYTEQTTKSLLSALYSAPLYYAVALGSLAIVLFAALRPITEEHPPTFWTRLTPTWMFFVTVAAALVAWRWPAILLNLQINPDESEFIAMAHLAGTRPIPWLDFDGTTSGPFNVWPLTLLHAVGLSLTYATARWMTVGLLLVTIFTLYRCMRLLFGEAAARLSSLCATCVLATASYEPEFAYYTSETMLLLLTACFALAIVKLTMNPARLSIVYSGVAGALAGAIPLAKLQGAPIDAALIAIAISVILTRPLPRRQRFVDLATFILAALAITAAVLGPVTLAGAWYDFLISYIREQLWLTSGRYVPLPGWQGQPDLKSHPSFFFLVVFSTALVAIMFALSLKRRPRVPREAELRTLRVSAATVLVLLAAIYAVMKPNEPWGGHLLLLLLPACALVGCSFAMMTTTNRHATHGRAAAAMLVIMLVVASAGVAVKVGNIFLMTLALSHAHMRYTWDGGEIRIGELALIKMIPQNSSLTIWGWAPEVYVLSNATMGTRDSETQFQMWPGPYQAYYLNRYLSDLQRNKPKYFFDAVRSSRGRSTLTGPQDQLEHFERLTAYISRHYKLIAQIDGLKLYRAI